MSGPRRLAEAGRIDRGRPIRFRFDGRAYTGFEGDTLASALLANGVRLLGRSFKYHRPRGVFSAGVEEPNALVGVGEGGRFEPNTRATDVFIYEGLVATSQNRWPSLTADFGAVNQWFAPFIPVGFYYKTFFGGPRAWRFYEHFIRRAAGLGRPPRTEEPDVFEHRAAFCDVLVVGGGPSGLAAASSATEAGARVFLVEQDERLGGSVLACPARFDGRDMADWAADVRAKVVSTGGRVLTRTTAAGYWDHNLISLAERLGEPGQTPRAGGPVQRLWRVRARRVILATGAIERPLLFGGNDRPGVMLSSAVRAYVTRFGVLPGQRIVIATCNDDAYLTAMQIKRAGGKISGIIDSRPDADSEIVRQVSLSAPVRFDAAPVNAIGGTHGVTGLDAVVGGKALRLDCDLIAVSGGFTPVVHLHMHAGGGLDWDEASGGFVPTSSRQSQISVGAAAGLDGLQQVLDNGWAAGVAASAQLDLETASRAAPMGVPTIAHASRIGAALHPTPGSPLKTTFIDLQNDVTASDIDLAWREGYRSVEHLKRYTTLGMATDQGKTGNILGLARLAAAEGRPIPEVGLTTFRPPYTPVTLGLLAGEATGFHVAPERRLPLDAQHESARVAWQTSGYWRRPRVFPKLGETIQQAGLREARAVRSRVGLTDVSSLAKFEIVGPDAAALLEIVCATSVSKLAVGRGKYTFMLREDGFVCDDGTVWRLAEKQYFLTSSTGGADRMAEHISYVRKVLAPHLRVAVVTSQERWAAATLAGPRSRWVIAQLLQAPPPSHMSALTGRIGDVDVRVLAASYSGERAFEIYAAATEMPPVWEALARAVEADGGAAYGLDALELLRIEKGHVEVGAEIDGRRTPADLGLHRMLNRRGGFVGAQGLSRQALQDSDRQVLVGLAAEEPIPEGAMLIVSKGASPEGHVTSAGARLSGDGAVALGLLVNGGARMGEGLWAASPTRGKLVKVRVVAPHFHDPAGDRFRD